VQNDYYCDSGTAASNPAVDRFWDIDPLWDGQGNMLQHLTTRS